ncbi:hypothetical protein ACH40E_12145 [Streptomyces acidicola]|uniref:hypothetical protein n=1 Tax=Streptomyces acidicola TaxID=2596892 RepID=UPI0037BA0C4B
MADIETGWSPACDSQTPASDEWGVLKVSAVTSGQFDSREAKRLPSGLRPRPHIEVKEGDVLVARANGVRSLVGVVCQVGPTRRRLMLSDKVLRLLPDESKAERDFLPVLLRSARVRSQVESLLNGGTGQNNISQTDIRSLLVPCVGLDAQRRIVAAHAAFERRIAGLERVREKLRVAERATLASLVSRAASSERMLLSDLLEDIETGWSPACDSRPPAGDEWGVIKVSAITSGRFEPRESKRLPEGLVPRSRIEIREGDILVARANGARTLVGAVCQVGPTRRKLMLSDKILRIIPDQTQAESAFLPVLLRSEGVRRQIGNLLNGGTGQNNISQADLRALEVPRLTLEEQQQIIATQANWQRRFEAVGSQMEKLRMVQQAVTEDLLCC